MWKTTKWKKLFTILTSIPSTSLTCFYNTSSTRSTPQHIVMHQSLSIFIFLTYFILPTIAVPATSLSVSPFGNVSHKPIHNETTPFINVTVEAGKQSRIGTRKALPVNIQNMKMPSNLPAYPGGATVPGLVPAGVEAGGAGNSGCVPATTNSQSNQCSSGVPYCCSPNGDGGTLFSLLHFVFPRLFPTPRGEKRPLISYGRTQLPK
jgi:hypothetical protein